MYSMTRHILEFFEVLSYLYCFAAIYGKKVKFNIYVVVFMVSELVLMTGLNEYGFPKYLVSLSYVLMILYCMLNYDGTVIRTLLNVGISFAVIGILQLLFYFIIATLFMENNIGDLDWELYIMILCFATIRLLGTKIKLKELSDFLYQRKLMLGIIGVFALLVLGGQIWKMKRDNSISGKDVIYVLYFFLLLFLLIYEWQKTKVDAEKKKMQLEMNSIYYSAYEDLIRSVREKQHDFKNHMNAIKGMLYSIEDYEQLVRCESEYLGTILCETEETSILTLVENPLLAGFLSEKIHEAEKYQIEVIYHCVFANDSLRVPEYKLIEMMGILIDNAIEAVEQENCSKVIELNLSQEDGTIIFEAINECNADKIRIVPKFFELGYSSKGENRGIGLAKLKRMLEEEHGEIFAIKKSVKGKEGICFRIEIPMLNA